MDIGGAGGPGAGAPMGGGNPFAVQAKTVAKPTEESQMSIGQKLNQMSGVETEKNLYKGTGGKQEMGKDAFLKLFMEQLKYQDPMNPVKNDQFNQQMAMFSQLEQQVNMNKNLEKMLGQQNNMQIAALQLVGKDITADRGALYHDKDKHTALNFKLPQDMTEVNIQIVDQIGETVRNYKLDSRPAGDVAWKWDGNTDQGVPMPAGKYSYKISGKGNDGKEITINNRVDGRVNGVTTAQGVVFLLVGDQRIALNDVEMIKDPNAPKTPDANAAPVSSVPNNGAPAAGTVMGKGPGGMNIVMGADGKPTVQNASQPAEATKTAPPPGGKDEKTAPATQQAASSQRQPASSEAEGNYALSHDSFDDVGNESDGSTAGTNSESNSSNDDGFDGMPPQLMPLFTR